MRISGSSRSSGRFRSHSGSSPVPVLLWEKAQQHRHQPGEDHLVGGAWSRRHEQESVEQLVPLAIAREAAQVVGGVGWDPWLAGFRPCLPVVPSAL